MFRLFEKYTQIFNTYANTIQNLFIVPMYLLCNRKFCFSFQFASYVFTKHQSKIAFTQHLDVHFYFHQYILSVYIVLYVYSIYVNETYLQPMFLLCDILIQFYHDIKATQLLHKRIFSNVTHIKNNVVYAFPM